MRNKFTWVVVKKSLLITSLLLSQKKHKSSKFGKIARTPKLNNDLQNRFFNFRHASYAFVILSLSKSKNEIISQLNDVRPSKNRFVTSM